MNFENYFPVWNDLNTAQKNLISDSLTARQVKKGTILHNGNLDCTGLLLIKSGQLRTYILSDEGREITLYRLFDMDMCLLSASCIMRSIQFEVIIEAEKDTDLWVIPAETYKSIMQESAAAANYTNELMASRFSDVMWLIEQIMWKSLDKRVALFLFEEASIEGSNELEITHETPTLISDRSSAISSMIGTTIRQGAHQGAQKSSRTGLSEFITSF